mmetsp:Transcript_109889/g.354800  ORF Transcript_109889/g.354800 Transcript_109889/m.354800 type:complete len:224 (+) Transcript_109889:1157-1828(+)
MRGWRPDSTGLAPPAGVPLPVRGLPRRPPSPPHGWRTRPVRRCMRRHRCQAWRSRQCSRPVRRCRRPGRRTAPQRGQPCRQRRSHLWQTCSVLLGRLALPAQPRPPQLRRPRWETRPHRRLQPLYLGQLASPALVHPQPCRQRRLAPRPAPGHLRWLLRRPRLRRRSPRSRRHCPRARWRRELTPHGQAAIGAQRRRQRSRRPRPSPWLSRQCPAPRRGRLCP